ALVECAAGAYGPRAHPIQAALCCTPAYAGIKAPGTIVHRYLLEDVPTGLVPLVGLAAAAGLATPTLRGLVERARAALGGEAWRRQRSLDALGLGGLEPEEIRDFAEGGLAPARAGTVTYGHFASGVGLVAQA